MDLIREILHIAEHFRKLVQPGQASTDSNENEKHEPFLVLGHHLRGYFNKVNPFRSQYISLERTQLLSTLVKSDKKSSSFYTDLKNRTGYAGQFGLNSEGQRSSRNWGELIKSSFERNTSKLAKSLRRATRTRSGASFTNQLSKTFHQSDYIASKFLQHMMMKKKSSTKDMVERKTLQGLSKILRKTRTPILSFIDNKNFIIAGAHYLRVYHLSENLW